MIIGVSTVIPFRLFFLLSTCSMAPRCLQNKVQALQSGIYTLPQLSPNLFFITIEPAAKYYKMLGLCCPSFLCSIAPPWDAHPFSSIFPNAAHPSRPPPPQGSPSIPALTDLSPQVTALSLSQCCSSGSPSNKRVLVFKSCLLHFVLCVCVCVCVCVCLVS